MGMSIEPQMSAGSLSISRIPRGPEKGLDRGTLERSTGLLEMKILRNPVSKSRPGAKVNPGNRTPLDP